METINQYQHVRLRPGMYGLHDNYFHKIFTQCLLDLLHDYSFSLLKISIDTKRNQVVFEASERKNFCVAEEDCCAFIIVAAISSSARFSGEYKDGSFRRTVIKEMKEIENAFDFRLDPDLMRLECSFVLPMKFPVDENYVWGKVDWFSRIFPDCRIIYNDHEYIGADTKNKMTYFLLLGHNCDPRRSLGHGKYEPFPVSIYEFNDRKDEFSWEVSFTFAPSIKRTSINLIQKGRSTVPASGLFPWTFINGIRTLRGGTHIDCITRAIEQAFQQTGNAQSIQFENMTLAVSIHLPPPVSAIIFDSCRCCGSDLKLISEHQEFKLMERDLKSQIIKYFSKQTERGAK